MLTPRNEHRLDGQCKRIYDALTQLIRSLDDIAVVVVDIDGDEGTDARERVARLITAGERAAIRAQLVTWQNTLQTRWDPEPEA